VSVRALINNKTEVLCAGMNVKVIVKIEYPQSLIVPIKALVKSGENSVVFTFSNGLAKWNFVKTEGRNSNYYRITEGLKVGDIVITEGNLNLSHDAKVKIIQKGY
jgi:membrane fusion protein, multidrug efflux system